MPLPSARRTHEYALKGVHLVLRSVGSAPEQRRARVLAASSLPADGKTTSRRVVIVTPRDWSAQVAWESVIAHALRIRGADVQFITCGGGLEICDRANCWEAPPMPCASCSSYVERTLAAHGFDRHTIRSGWDDADVPGAWPEIDALSHADLSSVEQDGLALGELTDIPVKWFLMSASTDDDPLGPLTRRRFLRAGRRVARGLQRQLDLLRPDVVLLLNGLFFFESIAAEICRQRGIDVVTYERGFRPGSLVFRRGTPACMMDLSGVWEQVGHRPLEADQHQAIDSFLLARGLPLSAPSADRSPGDGRQAVLFSNLTWDSAVLGQERAFRSLQDWIAATVDVFRERPADQLVIRIHPAETSLPGKLTREPLVPFISEHLGVLPPNVRIVGPDAAESSYSLMAESDLGLVFTSTTGLEVAALGKPVIVAGSTHYDGKGFTIDVTSPTEYGDTLAAVLDDPVKHAPNPELARRYAYYLFLGVPIGPMGITEPVPGIATLLVRDLTELAPGHDPDVDLVCDGILQGGDFFTRSDSMPPEAPVRHGP